MPKINQEEYEVLKGLDDRWKWIARNYNGALITYTDKPMKNPNLYWDSFGERMDDRLFQFIQWGDEEPYEIAELIEEYEKDYKGSWEHAIEFSEEVFGESEETEVKDLRWAKKTISELRNNKELDRTETNLNIEVGKLQRRAWNNCIDRVLEILNQLDEPEVLSQEWISDNTVVGQYPDGMGYVVPAYKLQNLLVPKQELPVIPKFVANILEKNTFADLPTAFEELFSANAGHYYGEDVCKWIVSNEETFARAWLDGYEVEEEQEYRVIDSHKVYLLAKEEDRNEVETVAKFVEIYGYNHAELNYNLTEQEIKDYDPRYWPFAVKVEELE